MPIAGPTYPFANNDTLTTTLVDKFVAQSFITDSSNRGLYDIVVELRRLNNPTGNLYMVIFDDDGSGEPNDPVENGLSQTILDVSTITTGATTQYTFDFFDNPPYLLANTKYHFVLMTDGDQDGSNLIRCATDTSAPSFADGNLCLFTDGSLEWTTSITSDMGFVARYTDVAPDAPESELIDLEWDCDCDDQDEIMESNLAIIDALKTVMINKIHPILHAYTPYFPGQGYWESEWIRQGNSLPLPDGITLLWYDTLNNTFGATYTAINGVVQEVIYKYVKGTVYSRTPFTTTPTNQNVALSNSYGGATLGVIDGGTIVVPVTSYLRFSHTIYSLLTTGWNYFLAGANQYHSEFGTAVSTDHYAKFVGPAAPNFSPFQIKWQHYQTLAPGSYTFNIQLFSPAGTGQYNIYYGLGSMAADPIDMNTNGLIELGSWNLIVA